MTCGRPIDLASGGQIASADAEPSTSRTRYLRYWTARVTSLSTWIRVHAAPLFPGLSRRLRTTVRGRWRTGSRNCWSRPVPYTNYWTGYMLRSAEQPECSFRMRRIWCSTFRLVPGWFLVPVTYNLRDLHDRRNARSWQGQRRCTHAGWVEVQANEDVFISAGFPTQLLFDIPFGMPWVDPGWWYLLVSAVVAEQRCRYVCTGCR